MNLKHKLILMQACLLCCTATVLAASTIDPDNKYAYGANMGWVNAYADNGTNGAVIGQAFCSGHMYGANVGWIHLGDGAPANNMAYGNTSATDYGINHDGLGNLSGYAYGANIGWINFEQGQGKPKIDLLTGALSGYAWGANVGWINLSGLATLSLAILDTDGDGIPDAWEFGHTNTLVVLDKNGKDSDGDGIPDVGEYAGDTDPFDPGDFLRITDFEVVGMTTNNVTWPVKTTRLYTLQHAAALSNGMEWTMTSSSFIPPSGPEVMEPVIGVADTNRFYRVQAEPPLSP